MSTTTAPTSTPVPERINKNNEEKKTASPTTMSAADTCRRTAAIRAVASENPKNNFSDDLARVLAGDNQFHQVDSMPDMKALKENEVNAVVSRAMWIDKVLEGYRKEHSEEIGQVVILESGMDTRAYRLDQADIA